jgi:hypothetical protein
MTSAKLPMGWIFVSVWGDSCANFDGVDINVLGGGGMFSNISRG